MPFLFILLKLQMIKHTITTIILFLISIMYADAQPIQSVIGTEETSESNSIRIKLIHKIQHFNAKDTATYDIDINSPKSVNIHPSGRKFYVNSLEGCATVVYEMGTWKKLKVIHHEFNEQNHHLWAKPSGLFEFTHYDSSKRDLNTFNGKPVESTFSHQGRYIWVPYYRRSFDLNAQDPSALAVIDTRNDEIVRMFETGPIPKMVACSHDSRHLAVSHWGDNTVGIINIEGNSPELWHYEKLHVIDYKLKLNYSLTTPVNRDANSGYVLRGTVFTPDDHYLLVGCMGGGGGIAVIDMQKEEYLGRVLGMRANIRHLIIKEGWLYLSINAGGVVQRIRLEKFLSALPAMRNHKTQISGWEECAVLPGARTIEASPSGRFIFSSCNMGSKLCVVDTRCMKMVASADIDSYPVGLDISKDGSTVITTSQGRKNQGGGNAVNIFHISYADPEPVIDTNSEILEKEMDDSTTTISDSTSTDQDQNKSNSKSFFSLKKIVLGIGIIILFFLFMFLISKKSKK